MLLFVILLLVSRCTAQNALWGELGGNPQHTAVSPQALLDPSQNFQKIWNHTNNLVLSTCVVDVDAQYICLSVNNGSMALNRFGVSGSTIWSTDIQTELEVGCGVAPTIALDPTIGQGYLWLGSSLIAFNSSTGNSSWVSNGLISSFTAIFATVNLITNEVYVFGGGKLVSVNAHGNLNWNIEIFAENPSNGTICGPPAINTEGSYLFLHSPGGLYKMNTTSSAKIWVQPIPGEHIAAFSSPVVDELRNYVIVLTSSTNPSESTLFVFDQINGSMKFNYTFPGAYIYYGPSTSAYQPMVLFPSGQLVVNIVNTALYSFDLNTLQLTQVLKSQPVQIESIAGASNEILITFQTNKSQNELCTFTSTLKPIHCTQVGNSMNLLYPILVGQGGSVLLQYIFNSTIMTPEFASYGVMHKYE